MARTCPACGLDMPPTATRHWRYCTPRCRTWTRKAGGPAAAAELLDSWAAEWSANADLVDPEQAEVRAAALRHRATIMRGFE